MWCIPIHVLKKLFSPDQISTCEDDPSDASTLERHDVADDNLSSLLGAAAEDDSHTASQG